MDFNKQKYNLPSYIDATSFKYLKIDDKYLIGIIIKSLPHQLNFLDVMNGIPKNEIYDLSIYVSKKDTSKILKELTYYISSSNSEIKTSKGNQSDIDILTKTKDDARELRKKIQIEGEEIFYVNFVITMVDEDSTTLLRRAKNFQSKLYAKAIFSNLLNFRHLDAYQLTLPLGYPINKIIEKEYVNITTSGLSYIFPFYKTNIFDNNGIIFGYTLNENKLCNLDVFDQKYTNSNMCIFGSSGSGKSYFTKIMIIRNYLNGISQYIFDIEGEYINLSKNLDLGYISLVNDSHFYYNPFQIYDYEVKAENYLDKKIDKLLKFITSLCGFCKEAQIKEIKKAIARLYDEYSITSDRNSVISKENMSITKKILKNYQFPTFTELIPLLKTKKIKDVIKEKIINVFPVLCKITNIDNLKQLLVIHVGNITTEALNVASYLLNEMEEITKENTQKTLLYMDEVWKYISNKDTAMIGDKIFEMYKTIRKSKAGIVTITQDITDFFNYQEGNYGKSILNNSAFKLFFKLDFSDIDILSKLSCINSNIINSISKLDKGQALIVFSNNTFIINIKSNEYEKEIIDER
ncbi:MAG: DUF87 domain-containing protein [Clostridia bacterium]|nr:DUF87 domain-containing protein [Clostridia bacterium]